ncbi:hypothetical protein NW755_009883 [Fusarium falciforme]|uniref:Uncharacterized protein n=1 Tax=Fusarium falciforme TaxID=195108 RepID=A0A9W8UWJ1_9HYPO|nr:hypothetical protein NW755_009883 [Fusarium falciforme]
MPERARIRTLSVERQPMFDEKLQDAPITLQIATMKGGSPRVCTDFRVTPKLQKKTSALQGIGRDSMV